MWEQNLLLWIHSHSTLFLDRLFIRTEFLGTTWFFTVLVSTVILWHLVRKQRREAVAWSAAGILTYCLKVILKGYAARQRPYLWSALISEPGYAFPSGHALGAAAFYPLLAWTVSGVRSKWKGLSVTVAAAAALLVGFGRLYLGLHWPTDVLAGWAIGFAVCASVIITLEVGRPVPNEAESSPHLPPWSVMPIDELQRLDTPPILERQDQLVLFGFGFAVGFGAGFFSEIDPLKFHGVSGAVILWIVVLIINFFTTGAFGYKQWNYYNHLGGHRKEGIFVQTVGMVNRREETLDAILCVLGGMLTGLFCLPCVWLVVLAVYSSAVAVRAHLVRQRPVYFKRLQRQGIQVPELYRRFECRHHEYWVPAIMLGWVYVHTIIAVTATAAAVFFWVEGLRLTSGLGLVLLLLARAFVGAGLLGESVRLSTKGYMLGLRRCPVPPDHGDVLSQGKSEVVTPSSLKKKRREQKGGKR